MPELKINNLSKSFGKRRILSDISLEADSGELIVILGPSGCGKSTLLRLLAGLETADSGEMYIGEKRIDLLPPQKRNVALVFQNYALYPHMTVSQNLAFPLKVMRVEKERIKDRVREIAEMIDLPDRLDARPAELSGGQRQRVALGRAIIREPDLFLLDEPLSNLDADLRQSLRRELVALQRKLKTTTVYVTHDQVEAMTMADRMVVLQEGKIRQIGKPAEVYNEPNDIFVASFLGTPKINLIEGSIGDGALQPLGIPGHDLNYGIDERELVLGIRPEDIRLDAGGKYAGEIRDLEYLGDKVIISIEFAGNSLSAIAKDGDWEIGTITQFSIPSEKLLAFNKATGLRLAERH